MTKLKFTLQLFATDTTSSAGMSVEMRTFYEKRLIQSAKPELVFNKFADKYKIPANGGKTIQLRKFSALPKALTPLTEGVTPAGSNLTASEITATINQYGDFIRQTDVLQMTTIDNVIIQGTEALGDQSGRTLDTIARNELVGGTNVFYASTWAGTTETQVEARKDLDKSSKLTPYLIARVATHLKSSNARKIDGNFVGIVHPNTSFDVMQADAWVEAQKYARPENIAEGEIGKIHGVAFFESTEAPILRAANLTAAARNLTVKTAISSSTTTIAVKEAISSAEATALANRYINVGGTQMKLASATSGAAGSASLTLATAIDSLAADLIIYPGEYSKDGCSIYQTVFLGKGAYSAIDIEGGGLQHIVKPLGSGDDPLNQRSTIGWKASYVVKRLCEEFLVRVEHSATECNAAAN